MDQLITVLIAASYVIGPLSVVAMAYVGYRLIQDQKQKKRERS